LLSTALLSSGDAKEMASVHRGKNRILFFCCKHFPMLTPRIGVAREAYRAMDPPNF